MWFPKIFIVLSTVFSVINSQCFSVDDNQPTYEQPSLQHVTNFGLELFKKFLPDHPNFFFAPYNVWSSFALAYLGSAGNTQKQLEKVLRVSDKINTLKLWRALEYIYNIREKGSSAHTFRVANTAYIDTNLTLRSCVKNILRTELQLLDLSKHEESASIINNQVSQVTANRIQSVVTPNDLNFAKMVMVSAAYFKDSWKKEFNPEKTKNDIFYTTAKDHSFVQMMKRKGYYNYGVSEKLGAQILELPYTMDDISMFILLPSFDAEGASFEHLIRKLDSDTLEDAIQNVWAGEVDVTLPKFTMETTMQDELKHAIRSMGITDLFDIERANLTTFAPNGELSIQKTVHKAFVQVSEEGTEAAGVAAVIALARSSRPLHAPKFNCNHPFVFIIYDKLVHNVLFMGAFRNPKK